MIFFFLFFFEIEKDQNLRQSREKCNMMREMYNNLACSSSDAGEFLSASWLTSWLGDQHDLGAIDNRSLFCQHDKLNPDKYKELKLISSQMVTFFFILLLIFPPPQLFMLFDFL